MPKLHDPYEFLPWKPDTSLSHILSEMYYKKDFSTPSPFDTSEPEIRYGNGNELKLLQMYTVTMMMFVCVLIMLLVGRLLLQ